MVGELLIFRRQRGIELDGHAMGRWNGDDDEPGLGLTLIGRDRHTRSVPVDATHRGVEQDACAELGGGRLGDLLCPPGTRSCWAPFLTSSSRSRPPAART